MQKTAGKNTKYWRNETILKSRHLAKAIVHAKAIYSLCKMVTLGQKLKMPKSCEKPFYNNITVVLCKKPLEKTPNIGEIRQFWNPAIFQGYSPWKGYSLCKMVTLAQKLKMPKTCEKPFYNNFTVVLCKKPLEKNTKYWRNETILKSRHLAKAIVHEKAIAFAKCSVWVKN